MQRISVSLLTVQDILVGDGLKYSSCPTVFPCHIFDVSVLTETLTGYSMFLGATLMKWISARVYFEMI